MRIDRVVRLRPLHGLATVAFLAMPMAQRVHAVPGDLVARHAQPVCPGGSPASGIDADGEILYYTIAGYSSSVYRLDLKTGADLGSAPVLRGGLPVTDFLIGVGYDSNRNALWIGGASRFIGVRLSDMESFLTVFLPETGVECVAYDPNRDLVWEADTEATVPGPSGYSPADGLLEGTTLAYSETGTTFDGVDLWHVTKDRLITPDPPLEGVLYPTVAGAPDWSRVVDLPGREWGEAAFDCVTFGKPVVWVVDLQGCAFAAYEVATSGPCLQSPAPRIASAYLAPDRSNLAAKFPLDGTRADRLFRAAAPLDIRDPLRILYDLNRPFIAYRWVDTAENPMGNILKVTKVPADSAVRISQ